MEGNSKQANMILTSNLWKVMIKLSLPAVIGMVLHGLNLVFDAIFVGNYVGELALSGVSIAYPLTQIAVGFGSMIGGGAGAYLSIAIGEKDKETQDRILGNTNWMGIGATIFLMIALFLGAKPLLMFMGGTGEVLEIGLSYFRITVAGTLFWVFSLAYNLIIRAEGKMGMAALIMGSGLVVNILANYLLMGIFHFGVVGAAWGTNLGMFVYTLLSVLYFRSGRASFRAKVLSFRRDDKIIKKIVSLGMPSLIMSIMSLIQGVVVLNAIGAVGTDYDLAFYGVSYRVYMFMMTPLFALMRSLQPAVGMNFGAKQYERVIQVTKVYILGSLIIITPLWLWVVANPKMVLSLIFESPITEANILNFRMFISVIPLLAITMNGMSYFPSIGAGKTAGIVSILRQVVLYIPAMIFLPRLFGVRFVYAGSLMIDGVLTLLLGALMLQSFHTLRKKGARCQGAL